MERNLSISVRLDLAAAAAAAFPRARIIATLSAGQISLDGSHTLAGKCCQLFICRSFILFYFILASTPEATLFHFATNFILALPSCKLGLSLFVQRQRQRRRQLNCSRPAGRPPVRPLVMVTALAGHLRAPPARRSGAPWAGGRARRRGQPAGRAGYCSARECYCAQRLAAIEQKTKSAARSPSCQLPEFHHPAALGRPALDEPLGSQVH